jgi:hypothetical protein
MLLSCRLFPDVKVAQAALLCSSIAGFLQGHGMAPGQVPVVVGGDFNSIWQKFSSDQWDQVRCCCCCCRCELS